MLSFEPKVGDIVTIDDACPTKECWHNLQRTGLAKIRITEVVTHLDGSGGVFADRLSGVYIEDESVKFFCSCGELRYLKLVAAYVPPATLLSTTSNIFMSLLTKFNNLFATEEAKLLKKYGVEDPTNVPTAEGIALLNAILYAENRDKVIAKVKEIAAVDEAEEAKKTG